MTTSIHPDIDFPVIYRCYRKGCKGTLRHVFTKTGTEKVYNRFGGYEKLAHGFIRDARFVDYTRYLPGPCPDCGQETLSGKPVQGTYNPDVKCNAKCEGARRHVCECSCGGANHGGAYG